MHTIHARNVNDAFQQGVSLFLQGGSWRLPSRAGDVLEHDTPVTTCLSHPTERVLWDAVRDCNPFFHLFESLWMLAGRNDSEYLMRFNRKMGNFAEGGVYHGAYGYRWRNWFGFDQIVECIKMLKADPMTRRCVLTMWSPLGDLINADGGAGGASSLDLPCNMLIKFEARKGRLDMIVYNRSNDMIWGAYGANAVHMSFLQEFVSCCTGIPMGCYWQVSGNFHVYENVWKDKVRPDGTVDADLYACKLAKPGPLLPTGYDPASALLEIETFVEEGSGSVYALPFLENAATLYRIWEHWKLNRAKALLMIQHLPNQDNDWVKACRMWMERRASK